MNLIMKTLSFYVLLILVMSFSAEAQLNGCYWCFTDNTGYCSTNGGYDFGYTGCSCMEDGNCACNGVCTGDIQIIPLGENFETEILNIHPIPTSGIAVYTEEDFSIPELEVGKINGKIDENVFFFKNLGLVRISANKYILYDLRNLDSFDIINCNNELIATVTKITNL